MYASIPKIFFYSSSGDGVNIVLNDILQSNTGFSSLAHITPEYILRQSCLGDCVAEILKNFKNFKFKKSMLHTLKSQENTKEKYAKLNPQELLTLLKMSPFSKKVEEDEVPVSMLSVIKATL